MENKNKRKAEGEGGSLWKEGRRERKKIENKRGQEKVWERRRRVGSGSGEEGSPSSATREDNDQTDTSDRKQMEQQNCSETGLRKLHLCRDHTVLVNVVWFSLYEKETAPATQVGGRSRRCSSRQVCCRVPSMSPALSKCFYWCCCRISCTVVKRVSGEMIPSFRSWLDIWFRAINKVCLLPFSLSPVHCSYPCHPRPAPPSPTQPVLPVSWASFQT